MTHTLVKVKWLDSRISEGHWERISDTLYPVLCHVETVGWIIKESDDSILIAQGLADRDDKDPMTAGRTTIARCQITEILNLAEVEDKNETT